MVIFASIVMSLIVLGVRSTIDELMAIVKLEKSQVLTNNEALAIDPYYERIITYRIPYAGYLKIEFSSSGGVYISVGGGYVGWDYMRYPPTGTETRGSFIAPVLPGTVYVRIGNPSRNPVVMTITVTYVY